MQTWKWNFYKQNNRVWYDKHEYRFHFTFTYENIAQNHHACIIYNSNVLLLLYFDRPRERNIIHWMQNWMELFMDKTIIFCCKPFMWNNSYSFHCHTNKNPIISLFFFMFVYLKYLQSHISFFVFHTARLYLSHELIRQKIYI